MELCGAFVCLNRHFPRTGCVWVGDTNQAVFQRKDTRPKQSPALPSISWDTPTIPYQAQGSSQNSPSFCQQVSNFNRRKMCLFFVLSCFSFLCFPSQPPSSSPSYPFLFLSLYFPLSLSLLPSSLLLSFLSFFLRKLQECAHTTKSSPMRKPI